MKVWDLDTELRLKKGENKHDMGIMRALWGRHTVWTSLVCSHFNWHRPYEVSFKSHWCVQVFLRTLSKIVEQPQAKWSNFHQFCASFKYYCRAVHDKSIYFSQVLYEQEVRQVTLCKTDFFWRIRAIEEINAEIYAAINQREPTNAHNKYNVVNSL